MRVLPVDLRALSDTERADLLAIRRASRGQPDLSQPVGERLQPGRRTACWLSYDGRDPVGVLSLVLPTETDSGRLRLDVDPARRREGAARQLLTEAVRMSWTLGRTALLGRSEPGGPGSEFARALGAESTGSDILVLPAPDGRSPIPPEVEVVEASGPEAAALAAVWLPDADLAVDHPVLQAVGRDRRTLGVAASAEGGAGVVRLAGDDPALATALAARLAVAGSMGVWIPRTGSPSGPPLATRTRWSVAVPELATRLGMC